MIEDNATRLEIFYEISRNITQNLMVDYRNLDHDIIYKNLLQGAQRYAMEVYGDSDFVDLVSMYTDSYKENFGELRGMIQTLLEQINERPTLMFVGFFRSGPDRGCMAEMIVDEIMNYIIEYHIGDIANHMRIVH